MDEIFLQRREAFDQKRFLENSRTILTKSWSFVICVAKNIFVLQLRFCAKKMFAPQWMYMEKKRILQRKFYFFYIVAAHLKSTFNKIKC